MASSINITIAMAKVILLVIGMKHEDVVSKGWPGSYEFYCVSPFDVKLSFDPYDGYYIKSYPSQAYLNMMHYLRFFVMFTKGLRSDNPPVWMDHTSVEKSMWAYCDAHKKGGLMWRWIETEELEEEFTTLLAKVKNQP